MVRASKLRPNRVTVIGDPKAILESVLAAPHTPPYKIHRYFARRPWNVFEKIIETYTKPGELILDPFMGGGVTIYEGIKLHRRVIGFDLNPLSHFIVTSMIQTDLEIELIQNYFNKIISLFRLRLDAAGSKENTEILWRELTYEVECNHCGSPTLLANEFKVGNGKYTCRNSTCNSKTQSDPTIKPKDCSRLGMVYLTSVKRSPTGESYSTCITPSESIKIVTNVSQLVTSLGIEEEFKARTLIPKNWDRQKEDLLEKKGFLHFEDFFTPNNLALNLGLKRIIDELPMPKKYHSFFRLVFSSSIRDTNVMTFTSPGWQGGTPTTWSRHAYWIPSQFCEVNVIDAFLRAYKRSIASLKFSHDMEFTAKSTSKWSNGGDHSAFVINGNLADSKLPSNYVDAIITDPPYGSNVQYLELSHFWFPWNKDLYNISQPDFSREAVSNRKSNFDGAKSMLEYEANLHIVFKKGFEVLKPGGVMVLTFNNKDMGAWLSLLISIFRSGFTLSPDEVYFQDGVKNYKQTAHTRSEGSPYGDFIYVFRKPIKWSTEKTMAIELPEFIAAIDSIFKYDGDLLRGDSGRYENQRERFVSSIPWVEAISRNPFIQSDLVQLFGHFGKNYLDHFYV